MSAIPLQGTGKLLAVSDNAGTPSDPMVLKASGDAPTTSVQLFGSGKYIGGSGAGTVADPFIPAVTVAGGGGGVANPMTSDLDAGGFSITNLASLSLGGVITITPSVGISVLNIGGSLILTGFLNADNGNFVSDGTGNVQAKSLSLSGTFSCDVDQVFSDGVGGFTMVGLTVTGGIAYMVGLPTSDPHVNGQLYSVAGAVMVSAG